MSAKIAIALIAATASVAVTSASIARPMQRFSIHDTNGNVLFDDGKLDGKGCVIGKKVIFDKNTGQLKVVPAAKCIGL